MPVSKRTTKQPPKSVGTRTDLTPLTDREQRFVLAFTTTCNFTDPQRAAREAGYAETEAGFTLADVVKKIGEIAFFDPRKLFNDHGGLLKPSEWPDDVTAAIAGVKTEELWSTGDVKVPIGDTHNIKWIERTKALDMLMKHLGGYEKDNDQKGQGGTDAVNELINVIRKVSGDACRLPIAPTNPG